MLKNFKKKFSFSFADVVFKIIKNFFFFLSQLLDIIINFFFSIFYNGNNKAIVSSSFENIFFSLVELIYNFVYSIYSFFKYVCEDCYHSILKSPFFNFTISFVVFLFYIGYFTNDAELILFFSCLLVIFIATFSVSKTIDAIMEEYSINIINILSERYFVQEEIFSFEKEMFTRAQLLDDFILYSTIFVEQQISQYVSLQTNLFSYHYSKIIESNLILDGEEMFTQEHLNSLLSFIELEKFIISYLIFDLILDAETD
jgi:hypothetical protein